MEIFIIGIIIPPFYKEIPLLLSTNLIFITLSMEYSLIKMAMKELFQLLKLSIMLTWQNSFIRCLLGHQLLRLFL